MYKNILKHVNLDNSNDYYLKITEQDKRKYGASRTYFLELIKRLSKKNGFCSAYDDYLMTHCNISKKTVYNYFKFFEELGILKREKDGHGKRIVIILSSKKITPKSVKFTPLGVSFTDEKPSEAIPAKGFLGVYNNIYNKNKTVYATDFSLEEIEKVFKEQISHLGIRIDDMVLLNEINKFEEYLKKRKKSKYSLKDQILFWVKNDKGCFKQALDYKIKLDYEEKKKMAEKEKRVKEEQNIKQNAEFFKVFDKLREKWKKNHKTPDIPFDVQCELSQKAQDLSIGFTKDKWDYVNLQNSPTLSS